jgi:hypothetical protein
VHQSESASYTSVLEAIQEQTARMAQDLGAIRLQNELEQLDRQWAIEREQYLNRRKDGTTSEPGAGAAGAIVGGLFIVIFAVIAIGIGMAAMEHHAPGLFAFVPFAMAAFAVVAFVVGVATSAQRATQYAETRQRYEDRRAKLLAEIDRQSGLEGRDDATKTADD